MIKSENITSKLLIRNSLYNVIAKIIFVGIGFVIIPFLIFKLGIESYGIWVLIGSIFRYRDIFSLGLNSAVNRYIPHYVATGEYNKVSKVISTALIFYICSSILFMLVSIILYYNLTNWFAIPEDLHSISKILVLLVGFGFSIIIPLNISTAILSSLQKYDILNIGIIIHVILRALILVFLLLNDFGLLAVGLTFVLSEIILKISYNYYSKRMLLNHSKISFKNIDFVLLKQMLAYGINTFLFSMSIVVIYRSSDMIIGIFRNVEDISKYSVITVLILVLHQLLQAFLSVIKPAISSLNATNSKNQITTIATLTQKYSLIFLIPSSIFFILFGKELLGIWISDEFSQLHSILTVLVIGNFFFLSQQSNYFVLVGKGEHKIFGIIAIITAISAVVFSIISLGFFKFGLISVAVSTSIPLILFAGILLQFYFNKKMNIKLMRTIKTSWFPALIGTLPALLILILSRYLIHPTNWIHLISIIITTALFTLIGTLLFATQADERKMLFQFLKLNRD